MMRTLNNKTLVENSKLQKGIMLEIIMQGDDFDGMLNFGSVVVSVDSKNEYILDALETNGKATGNGTYRLVTEFSKLEDTINMFDEGYEFNQSLEHLLKNKDAAAYTNLYFCSSDDEEVELMKANIARIQSMNLIHCSDVSIKIPVTQNDDF
ncbi:TPA: hypothetical protein I7730_00665 [Vibrio vulnificus]|uniref:Uncharacterized protein n=1 Tax=Vibrio vulnificus TaxID=672 RepID=A0A8H9K5L0_VIBVL|nr:hypothetical protein [Vibrio vulnificus]HAS8538311.1 hypothetical protein [Vibrio vulnificus]